MGVVTIDLAAKPYTDWDSVRTVNSHIGVLCLKKKLTMYGDGRLEYIYSRKCIVIQKGIITL